MKSQYAHSKWIIISNSEDKRASDNLFYTCNIIRFIFFGLCFDICEQREGQRWI